MADVDKIVRATEHRRCLKEWHKANSLQPKDFSYVILLLLLVGFLPLIVAVIKKVASLII